MITITDKEKCCGCEACTQICPKKCISFIEDEEGFCYPEVDESTCIDCGLCEKVCPVLNQWDEDVPETVVAAINEDEEVRFNSSSGGIFTLLGEKVIESGGVVFSAKFDENWNVAVAYTESSDGLQAFRGSKYLQARIDRSYKDCKCFLESGRRVLFTGTPCQIAGLLHYLRKPYSNLLAVEVLCYGVPSPLVWKSYLTEIRGMVSRLLEHDNFINRWKLLSKFHFRCSKRNDKIVLTSPASRNTYLRLFQKGLTIRPSCFSCPAKAGKSCADISLGDFWGVEDANTSMDDNKGVSMVILHTDKGRSFFDSLNVKRQDVCYNDISSHNKAYFSSATHNPERECFFKRLKQTGSVRRAASRFFHETLRLRMSDMKTLIRDFMKKDPKVIETLDNSSKDSPSKISFRHKERGWRNYDVRIEFPLN